MDKMKEITNTIKNRRLQLGLTYQELSNLTGMSKSTLQRYETGFIKNIPLDRLDILAEALRLDPAELLGWANVVALPKRTVKIPVLGSVPAGVPIEAIENILYEVELDADIAKNGRYFGLIIKGNSMSPHIMDQDLVIVRQQDDIENGEIGVAYINGYEATCKKILITDTGIILQPLNPEFPPQAYSWSDAERIPVRIVGKVVESRRRFG